MKIFLKRLFLLLLFIIFIIITKSSIYVSFNGFKFPFYFYFIDKIPYHNCLFLQHIKVNLCILEFLHTQYKYLFSCYEVSQRKISYLNPRWIKYYRKRVNKLNKICILQTVKKLTLNIVLPLLICTWNFLEFLVSNTINQLQGLEYF